MMSVAERLTALIDRLYLPQVAKFVPRDTFRYGACGVATYFVFDPLAYFIIYNCIVAHRYFDLGIVVLSPHIAALAAVFPLTLACGYWLNRHVAFEAADERKRTQLARYLLSIAGSLALNYIGMKVLVEMCGLWPTPAKLATTICVTVYSYLAAKYFTFRKS